MIAKPLPGDWASPTAWDSFWNTYEPTEIFDPAKVPIKPRQHPYEIYHFLRFLRQFEVKNVLEIGTYKGGTLWFWLNCINSEGLDRIICIDNKSEDYEYDPLGSTEYLTLWESWCKDSTNFSFILGDSIADTTYAKARELLGNTLLDFLFIDGKHTVEQVTEDFRLYSQLVRPGGIIALHDSANENVRPFCDQLRRKYQYREILSPITPLGIGWVIKD
jgi:predicted O-methyltransferase YrrM